MIRVFGGDVAHVVASSASSDVVELPVQRTLPADLAVELRSAAALVVLDPLAFPFEALCSGREVPLVVVFDEQIDTPAEIIAQLGSVLFETLTKGELVVAPAGLRMALAGRGYSFRVADRADVPKESLVHLARSLDVAAIRRHLVIGRLFRRCFDGALAELPKEVEPLLGWLDGGDGEFDFPLQEFDASSDRTNCAVVSFFLASRSDEQSLLSLEELFDALEPGGSCVVIEQVSGATQTTTVQRVLNLVAEASKRHAVLAEMTTAACADDAGNIERFAAVRVRRIGCSR